MKTVKEITEQKNLINDSVGISTHSSVFVADMGPHTHKFYEILYILSGELIHTVNGASEKLSPGDCVILPPGFYHSFRPVNCFKRDILISCDLFKKILSLVDGEEKAEKTPIRFKLGTEELMDTENSALRFSIQKNLTKKKCIGISMIYKLLAGSNLFGEDETREVFPDIVRKVCERLDKNVFMKNGYQYIVKDLGYNPSYVCRVFKKYMGVTPVAYINNIKLNHVALYLISTDYSLQQIANLVGWDSISYLTRVFKKKYGISPVQYKKRQKYAL